MVFENKYEAISLLGKGTFGSVYLGKNINTNEFVAIKIENKNNKIKTLLHEAKIYIYLNKLNGIPKIKTFGTNNDFNYLILERLGFSLYEITNKLGRFPINKLLIVAKDILQKIKNIHDKGIIHRDLKPDNFMFDYNGSNINIIDFGLSRQYLKNNKHILFKDNKNLLGTPIFASLNNHKGYELSRRDDIESFVYSLIYCAKGYLPWEAIKNKDELSKDEYNNQIFLIKKNTSIESLCEDINDWNNVKELIMYSRNILFEEKPEYNRIENLLYS